MVLSLAVSTTTLLALRNYDAQRSAIKSSEIKLSTGKRINKSADDAVGLALSQRIGHDITGFKRGLQNAQDGLSLLGVAEGGLISITEDLQRMRELTVGAANDSLSQKGRDAIAQELAALADDIDQVANSSTFNGIHLLDGSVTSIVIQIGGNSTASANSVNITSGLSNATNTAIGIYGGTAGFVNVNSIWNPATQTTMLTSSSVASNFLNDIDTALSRIQNQRTQIGASEAQLENDSQIINTNIESMTQAQSSIQDSDFAAESSLLAQQQILQQGSVSVLSQTYNIKKATVNALLNQ